MSDDKKKKNKENDKNEKDDFKGEPSSALKGAEGKTKADKRNLRFELPVPTEETFSSTSSLFGDDAEEGRSETQLPIFKKYVQQSFHHSQPRSVMVKSNFTTDPTTSIYTQLESTQILSAASSSRQLLEILRHSPSPSDADLNLISATYLRKLERVEEAINSGANVNTFRDRQTPLIIASEIGEERLVKYLLSVPKIDLDFRNTFGLTALAVAVRNVNMGIVSLLLNGNANVDIPDNLGRTPLHMALFQRRPDTVKLLLAFGANHEIRDCFGESPVYISAVKTPDLECLTILLNVGASLNRYNLLGTPLLSRAILNWTQFSIIQKLVKSGARVNSTDLNTGKTPLHFAAIINDVAIAKLLISHGAKPNIKTFNGVTPFDEAIFLGCKEVATFLQPLTRNASVKALSQLQETKSRHTLIRLG